MTESNNDVILEMKHITKVFLGVRALNDVQLTVRKGEIHALLGENGAGKSTLMKVLIGLIQPDRGEIIYNGHPVRFRSVSDALNAGISMIHQEISLVQEMTIAENIWLGRGEKFTKLGLINKNLCNKMTEDVLNQIGVVLDPRTKIKDLSVAQMQLVELARAVSYNSNIIIMDEPTSALTDREIKLLYSVAENLAKKGVAIIFISHKFEEVFAICSKITVLRDGTYIDTVNTEDIHETDLIRMVAGRDIKDSEVKLPADITDTMLSVKNLSCVPEFKDISFSVKKGEILGVYGLMGAKRTEIMRTIFGLDKKTGGEIYLEGNKIEIKSPRDAVKNKIGYISEDRLRLGVIYTLSIIGNTTLASFEKVCNRLGLFRRKNERAIFSNQANLLSIKYSSPDDLIGQLSGGNQQKVIVSRWLLTNPKILILDEPTRGVDVGAKAEIHSLICKMAQRGIAVIMVSSEIPEILSISDRVMVVREGKIVGEYDRSVATQDILARDAFGIE